MKDKLVEVIRQSDLFRMAELKALTHMDREAEYLAQAILSRLELDKEEVAIIIRQQFVGKFTYHEGTFELANKLADALSNAQNIISIRGEK